MYSAETIANWFLINIDRESGDSITHLKLQKLLYYAQAWYMVLTENEAEPILFEEKIEAWTHGPVVREVYNKYSEMRYDSIPRPDDNVVLDEEAEEILKEVLRVYGKYEAKYLEELTHQEDPWRITRGSLPLEARCTKEIDRNIILDFYKRMYESNAYEDKS